MRLMIKMAAQNKRFMNKILKEMKVDEKEKFIQQLIRTRLWDEKKIRERWSELEEKYLKLAKEHIKKYKKEKKEKKKHYRLSGEIFLSHPPSFLSKSYS